MDTYEIPKYVNQLIEGLSSTLYDLDWTVIIMNTIIYFFFLLILTIFLVVFFDKSVIRRFFSKESGEYVRPLIFYLFVLGLIQYINVQTNISAIFFEILFIILIVKSIGLIDAKTGEAILQILGGFALIQLILSPIGNLENMESTLVISLSIISFLLIIINGDRWREKVIFYYRKITNIIIQILIKETNPSMEK